MTSRGTARLRCSAVLERTPIAVRFSTVGEWGGVKVQR